MVMRPARLEVVGGNAVGTVLSVSDELLLGRSASGDGRLGEDAEISRDHARLTVDARGLCAIEDLGSTNGTFVNGRRITAPQTLVAGDAIEVGNTTLVVAELPQAADPRLSVSFEVDFATHEARIQLDESSAPVRLVYDAGQWRVAT